MRTQDLIIDRREALPKTLFYLEVVTLDHNNTYYICIQVEIIEEPKDDFFFNATVKPIIPEDPFFNDTLIKKMKIDLDNLD